MAVVGFVLGIAIVVGLIALYLLPYIIGAKRGIASTTALFWVNLPFGWTIIPWFACIPWALSR
jgi:hypothetical protein